jgi:tetratricopeptide (TPR) repeat protein
MGGRSLRRVLDSPTATLAGRAAYAESAAGRYRFGWGEVSSLTDGQYRYIRSGRPELYDLVKDPWMRTNLAETEAATAQKMRAALEALTGTVPLPAPSPVTEPERSRLAAMGYVTGLPAVPPEVPADQLPDVKDRVAVANAYWQAHALAASGRTADAIARYGELVARDPGFAIGWDRLVDLLTASGRFKEAAGALSSLLALFPEADRAAEAEQRLQRVMGPEPTAAHYVLAAKVWTSLGEKAKAAEVRAAARKAVGDAALRKAEAGFRD